MSWTGLLVALYYGLLGAALLLALWPTEQTGSRFLRRWGIAWPSRQQSTEAARYLRQRRVLCPVLFLLVPPALGAGYRLAGLSDSGAGVLRLLAPAPGWLERTAEHMNLLSLPLMFAAIVGWIWVANLPRRRQLRPQATT